MPKGSRTILWVVVMLFCTALWASQALAQISANGQKVQGARVVDAKDTITLTGNVYPLAKAEFDRGLTDRSLKMERIILMLRRSDAKEAELEKLLSDLHDPASPGFRRWLTPEEFGTRFGPSAEDIAAVTTWLESQGFVIDEVANYYVSRFNLGIFTAATLALIILDGAQPNQPVNERNDVAFVNNKLAAADLFTRTIDPDLDGLNLQATFSGYQDTAQARTFLSAVSWVPGTMPTPASTRTFIQQHIADPGDPILNQ